MITHVCCIKDLESEEAEKEETADALASTNNSSSTGFQGDMEKDQAGDHAQV